MPAHHHSIFMGRMLFLTPNQQCQSTEGFTTVTTYHGFCHHLEQCGTGCVQTLSSPCWHTQTHASGSLSCHDFHLHTMSHHSSFLQAGCPSCHPTNSIKALKAHYKQQQQQQQQQPQQQQQQQPFYGPMSRTTLVTQSQKTFTLSHLS